MRLIALTVLVALICVLARRAWFGLTLGAIALAVLVPTVVIGAFFPGPGGAVVHPSSLALTTILLIRAVTVPRMWRAMFDRSPEYVLVLIATSILILLQSSLSGGASAPAFVLDQVIAPTCAVILIAHACAERPRAAEAIRWTVLGAALLTAVVAILQRQSGSVILYGAAYQTQSWFVPGSNRWMGTLDHPLVLSLCLTAAIPLLAPARRWYVALPALGLLLGGVLISQSRLGIAAAVLGACYVLARTAVPGRARWGMAATFVAAAVVAVALGALGEVQARLSDGSDLSNEARSGAADYFFATLPDYAWIGHGVGSSYAVAGAAGLISSFENSFMIMAVDHGLVLTSLYFGLMVASMVLGLRRQAPRGFVPAGLIALVGVVSFSALGTPSASALILWVPLAVAAFGTPARHAVVPTPVDPHAQPRYRAVLPARAATGSPALHPPARPAADPPVGAP